MENEYVIIDDIDEVSDLPSARVRSWQEWRWTCFYDEITHLDVLCSLFVAKRGRVVIFMNNNAFDEILWWRPALSFAGYRSGGVRGGKESRESRLTRMIQSALGQPNSGYTGVCSTPLHQRDRAMGADAVLDK